MSAELQLSASSEAVDFPYRAISRGAIASLVFAVLSLIGLVPTFESMLVLTLIGIIAAVTALRTIRRYPEEYSGQMLARIGLAANAMILIGGVTLHTYIYLTEVPEGYERVPFYSLQTVEPAPDVPTPMASEIDGKKVFIKGYVHPASGGGRLRQFILVPDLGTCCFGGQPRSSDMIEVTLIGGQTVSSTMRRRKLAGTFSLNRIPQRRSDFDNTIYYRLRADQVK
jgi:hypothetical protein